MESNKLWVNNGLPRKGWAHDYVEDLGEALGSCVWCGTEIRYVHHLVHLFDELETTCGCICAEHLTEDYVNPRVREKKAKSEKAKNARWTNLEQWRQVNQVNCDTMYQRGRCLVYQENRRVGWKFSNIYKTYVSFRTYATKEEAMIEAKNTLFKSRKAY